MAKELREDGSILYTGEGTITTIERKTKLAKVSITVEGLQYPESGWWEIAKVEPFSTGDQVAYEILKAPGRDYRDIQKLAPLLGKEGDRDPAPQRLSASRVDDVQAGAANPILDSPAPAEHVVPNSDSQRFESWGFVANVGMVDLAYEELSDALEAGELDSISPELLRLVAQHLLNAADQAQRSLVGRTDRGAQSHTRARGCVRTALRKYPVRDVVSALPDPDPIDAWAVSIQKTATRLLLLAASL